MNAKIFPEFEKLERKARRAIKDTPEARLLDRELTGVERKLAAGRISKVVAACLKRLIRLSRQILVLQWVYAFLRGELPHAAK